MQKVAVLVLIAVILLSPLSPAQTAQQNGGTPAVHAEVREVIVDAVVTDKKGNYIQGLRPQDFRLLEDGKELPLKVAAGESSPAQQQQSLVLLFDLMQFDDQMFVRNAATHIIDSVVGPNRPLALVNYEGSGVMKIAHDFSTDATELKEVVRSAKSSGIYQADASTPRLGADTMYHPDATPKSDSFFGDTNSEFGVRSLLWSFETLARSLSKVPGPKTIVWFTPGIYTTPNTQGILLKLIEACNKSNITVYPIQVRINEVLQEPLRALATETGGFPVMGNNDVLTGLRSIAQDQDRRYLLTYTPVTPGSGGCHAGNVKVGREGAVVRTRKQYCEVRAGDLLADSDLAREMETHAGGSESGTLKAHVQAPFFYTGPGQARVHVAADVATDQLRFTKQNGSLHSTLKVLGIAYRSDGTIGARFSDSVDFNFNSKDEIEHFKQEPYHYQAQFDVPPGRYTLKLVFSPEAGNFGMAETRVAVAPYDDKLMSISGLAICKEFFNAGEGKTESLGASRAALISKGVQFNPAAETTFKKTDPATVYFEVYEPKTVSPTPETLQVQLRVTDLEQAQVKVDTGLMKIDNWKQPGKSVIPVALKLAVSSLPTGYYRVDVRVVNSSGGATPWRSAEFSVQ